MPVSGWPSRQHYSSDGLAKPSIGRSRRRPSGGSSVSGAPMKGAPNGKLSSVRSRQQGRPSPPSRTKAIRAAGVALRSHGAPGSEAEILCIACAILHISRIRSPVSMAIEDELEKLIKTRILNNEFDDVVRRTEADVRPHLASQAENFSDTNSKLSLAQLYEEDYVNTISSSGANGEPSSAVLKAQQEIEGLWENIAYKLDALCNVHFTPKPVRHTKFILRNSLYDAHTLLAKDVCCGSV